MRSKPAQSIYRAVSGTDVCELPRQLARTSNRMHLNSFRAFRSNRVSDVTKIDRRHVLRHDLVVVQRLHH